ncbi:MAG: hypothetical protein RL033_622 [Pseudomonadota bacterium]|jgi:hypothetical protein
MRLRKLAAHTWISLACVGVAAALVAVPRASAADTETNPRADAPPRHHHAPPPEAVEACESAEEGDDCSFELHDETIDGTCRKGRNEEQALACMPSHPPPHPPQAALAACEGLTAGAACSVQLEDETVGGTCRTGPNGDEPLACMPAR